MFAATALAAIALFGGASPAFAATYDPLDVIPYDTWRAADSMSASDIQSFLDAQSGPLKSLVTTDDAGVTKPASQIIWDAAQAWNLNPKIILATLQKEQSLLTTTNSSAATLLKAMGCGVYDNDGDGQVENQYPGFGPQIWNGARLLSTYEIRFGWFPGKPKTVTESAWSTKVVDGVTVKYHRTLTIYPVNASTFALYTYTPWYPQRLVWDVYVRYFGDPHSPARMSPIYRFKNRSTGAFYYTSSEGTRYSLISKSAASWTYDGIAFTIDASSTANTAPLYRLQHYKTKRYYYTTSAAKKDALLAVRPVAWRSAGTVGLVSKVATEGAIPVYLLQHKTDRGMLYTRFTSTITRLRTTYWNRGIAFYLGRSEETTTPVGP